MDTLHMSKRFGGVVTAYLGSLFVGHCSHEDLVVHFFNFLKSFNLSADLLFNVGMDGPTVNKAFLRKVVSELSKNNLSVIDIGSCPIHFANGAFRKFLNSIKSVLDLDEVAIDLHFFFKMCAARPEDYKKLEDITEITAHFMKEHVESRWLSIEKSLVRILEQIDNLREYSLTFLPKQKSFNHKNGLAQSPRYKRICAVLNTDVAEIYMAYVVTVARDFNRLVVPLQTSAPMVHRLYGLCCDLIRSLMGRVVKEDVMINGGKKVPLLELVDVDLLKEDKLKVCKSSYVPIFLFFSKIILL